jgi:ABC-type antimicrobial peptide transport system permease subunit
VDGLGQTIVVLAGAVVIGLGAAILPAFRAARMNTLTAIATEKPRP